MLDLRTRLRMHRFTLRGIGARARRLLRRGAYVLRRDGAAVVFRKLAGMARSARRAEPPRAVGYAKWLAENEPDDTQLSLQRRAAEKLAEQPLVSVVLLGGESGEMLRDSVSSIARQTYSRWEILCDADRIAGSPGGADSRIRTGDPPLRSLAEALSRARGDYVQFLEAGDRLGPSALYEAVRIIGSSAEAEGDGAYFDEDGPAGDVGGGRTPWFKPDWSPELLLSVHYLHGAIYRRGLLEEVVGDGVPLDEAGLWELALLCSERGRSLAHVPRVLLHRGERQRPIGESERKALERHLERLGLPSPAVELARPGSPRALWKTREGFVSIVIPTRDNVEVLRRCVSSILNETLYPEFELLLVDSGSVEEETRRYYQSLDSEPRVRILAFPPPFNYSAACNLGAREGRGDILLFLNNDVEVLHRDWLEEIVRWVERPEIGAVGAKLLYPNQTIQHAGMVMGLEGHGSHVFRGFPRSDASSLFGSPEWYRDYLSLTGAAVALRREVFEEVGGYDEAYQLCYSDIELCLEIASAGYRIVYDPFAELIHYEGMSRGLHFPPGDVERASRRMLPVVAAGDPFYNPNLSYRGPTPELATEDEENRRARLLRILRMFELPDEIPPSLEAWASWSPLLSRAAPWRIVRFSEPAPRSGPRLLLVTHDLTRSGAPLILHQLATRLAAAGYSIHVASPVDGRLRASYEAEGIPVIINPLVLDAPAALASVWNAYDLVVANTILAWQAAHAAKAAGLPCLWLVHEASFGSFFAAETPGAREALAGADAVVFPSRATASLYRRYDPHGKHQTIHYGIEAPQAAEPVVASDRRSFRVVHVGSIEPRKGQDLLLRAARRLARTEKSAYEFFLIGRSLDPIYADRVRELAAELGNVRILGEIPREDVLRRVAGADAVVCTSRDDPSPVFVIEAMALGKPLVSTRVGAVPEILEDGVSGLLIGHSPKALARSLEALRRDRERGARLGVEARRRFEERLTLGRYARDVEGLIRKLAPRRRDREAERRGIATFG